MRGRTPALLAAGLLTVATYADTPDAAGVAVSRLASPRYAEREKAAKDLEALGPAALKALTAAQASPDEEVRARARVIRDRIELVERSKRLLEAPTLRFQFADTPLDIAVSEFVRQTGLRVNYAPKPGADAKRKVSLDTSPLPYWEAVDAFYKAAGLTEDGPPPEAPDKKVLMTTGGRAQVILRSRLTMSPPGGLPTPLTDGAMTGPAASDRAVRVRALPPSFPGSKYDDIKGEVTIQLDVDAAPAVGLQEIVGVEVRGAAAEDGRPLAAAHPDLEPAAVDYGFSGRAQFVVIDDLTFPSATPDRQVPVVLKSGGLRPRALSELSGVLIARVQAPPEPLVAVENLLDARGKTATADGFALTVLAVEERPGNRLAVRAKLTTDPVRDDINFGVLIKGQVRQFINIARETEVPAGVHGYQVRTADGRPVANATTTMVRGTSDGRTSSTEVLILFPKPTDKAADLTLAYTGRRSVLVEMPFTLKNVPVP
ncbi:MAG TPA: hypothetical protein VM597_11060 [Gemmataceae bacterium]|nr:hypothetical protein [Gemmataceae bacterium]